MKESMFGGMNDELFSMMSSMMEDRNGVRRNGDRRNGDCQEER